MKLYLLGFFMTLCFCSSYWEDTEKDFGDWIAVIMYAIFWPISVSCFLGFYLRELQKRR